MSDNRSDPRSEQSASDGTSGLSTNDAFALLASPRRRRTLELLCEHDHVTLPDVAETVTEHQTGKLITEISPEAVKDTYMMLYHADVPKLVDYGVVVYDQEQDIVATGRDFETVAELLDRDFSF